MSVVQTVCGMWKLSMQWSATKDGKSRWRIRPPAISEFCILTVSHDSQIHNKSRLNSVENDRRWDILSAKLRALYKKQLKYPALPCEIRGFTTSFVVRISVWAHHEKLPTLSFFLFFFWVAGLLTQIQPTFPHAHASSNEYILKATYMQKPVFNKSSGKNLAATVWNMASVPGSLFRQWAQRDLGRRWLKSSIFCVWTAVGWESDADFELPVPLFLPERCLARHTVEHSFYQ